MYVITQKKCFAVVRTLLLLHPNLEDTYFLTWTDHDCQKWLLNLAAATGKIA